MYKFDKYNHGAHGDPHPQYNASKRYQYATTGDAPNNVLKLMEVDFVYDGNSGTDQQRAGIRRMRFSGDIFTTVTNGNQFIGNLNFSAFLTPEKNTTIPLDGFFRIKMSIDWKLQSFNDINRNNVPSIVYAFVTKLDYKDGTGMNKYKMRLYATTNVYDNICLIPKTLDVDMPYYKDYFVNNPSYPMSNISTNMIEKLDSVIKPYLGNPGISLDDVYKNNPGAAVFTSDHISNVNSRVTIHDHSKLSNTDYYALLDNSSNVVRLQNLSSTPYTLSQIILNDAYQGCRLAVIVEGNVVLSSLPQYSVNANPFSLWLKNGISRKLTRGDAIELIFINNIWVEFNGGGTNVSSQG